MILVNILYTLRFQIMTKIKIISLQSIFASDTDYNTKTFWKRQFFDYLEANEKANRLLSFHPDFHKG